MTKRPYDTFLELSGRFSAGFPTVNPPGPSHDSPHAAGGISTNSGIYARPQPYFWQPPTEPIGYGPYTPHVGLHSGISAEFELTGKATRVNVAMSTQPEGQLWGGPTPQPHHYPYFGGYDYRWQHGAAGWPPGYVPEARVPFEPQWQTGPGTFPPFGSPSAPPGNVYPMFPHHLVDSTQGYLVGSGSVTLPSAPGAVQSIPSECQRDSSILVTSASVSPSESHGIGYMHDGSRDLSGLEARRASLSATSGSDRDSSELNDEDIVPGEDKTSETIPTMPGVRVVRSGCGLRKFMCSQSSAGCSMTFGGVFDLRAHLRDVHGIKQPYQCLTCRQFFSSKAVLETHNRTHTGDKPFTCDHPGCTAAFAQKSNLKRHYRVHSGERPVRSPVRVCFRIVTWNLMRVSS